MLQLDSLTRDQLVFRQLQLFTRTLFLANSHACSGHLTCSIKICTRTISKIPIFCCLINYTCLLLSPSQPTWKCSSGYIYIRMSNKLQANRVLAIVFYRSSWTQSKISSQHLRASSNAESISVHMLSIDLDNNRQIRQPRLFPGNVSLMQLYILHPYFIFVYDNIFTSSFTDNLTSACFANMYTKPYFSIQRYVRDRKFGVLGIVKRTLIISFHSQFDGKYKTQYLNTKPCFQNVLLTKHIYLQKMLVTNGAI